STRLATGKPRRRSNKMIVVLSSYMLRELLIGIQSVIEGSGYDMFVRYAPPGKPFDVQSLLANRMIAGIIMTNIRLDAEDFSALAAKFPVIQCGQSIPYPNAFSVCSDDKQIAYDVMMHLAASGRRRIAFIGQVIYDIQYSNERKTGYLNALRDLNIPFDPDLLVESARGFDGGQKAAAALLALPEPPDAVLCVADDIAFGCVYELNRQKIAIPRTIAVAGINDQEYAHYSTPPLTTVHQAFEDIGAESARVLLGQIRGKPASGRRIFIEHTLVVRASTGGSVKD
ncbi:substrate-binding domain-containing protein, partial [Oscillospiraceae bacterium OttesenSCG-928-F05]|nr:substrate-binding domain-containing protein [Oscillospiraceae bacterium OttesenSCG-928-F05]